jgi:endonuclease III
VLRALTERLGGRRLTLSLLDNLDDHDALAFLRSLPGVGPKTAACVLLFALGRPVFPVDTHVWRVSQRLGLIGARVSADAAHETLGEAIAPAWRHTMHIDLIQHGRQVCHAQRPACTHCTLRSLCDFYWRGIADGSIT